jgi:PAS domain S-box-containing protein
MVCTNQGSLNPNSFSILESEDFAAGMVARPMLTADFWAVFSTSRNAMLLMDDERRYTDLNDAALQLFGARREDLVGRHSDELVPDDLRGETPGRWTAFLDQGHAHGHYALALPSGRRIEIEYSSTANVLPGRHLTIVLELDGVAPPRESLTVREREVVRAVAEGATTPEIAERLFISPTTVDTHVRKAMLRLGAKNRAHLIALALQGGEI